MEYLSWDRHRFILLPSAPYWPEMGLWAQLRQSLDSPPASFRAALGEEGKGKKNQHCVLSTVQQTGAGGGRMSPSLSAVPMASHGA